MEFENESIPTIYDDELERDQMGISEPNKSKRNDPIW
jgi:hypothetical protein